jgi:hypothetical protein
MEWVRGDGIESLLRNVHVLSGAKRSHRRSIRGQQPGKGRGGDSQALFGIFGDGEWNFESEKGWGIRD